jgi:hypothetical protein
MAADMAVIAVEVAGMAEVAGMPVGEIGTVVAGTAAAGMVKAGIIMVTVAAGELDPR